MLKQKLTMPCLIAGAALLLSTSPSFANEYIINCPLPDKIKCTQGDHGTCTATEVYDQNYKYSVEFQGEGIKGKLDEALLGGPAALDCYYNGGKLTLSGYAADPVHHGQSLQCDETANRKGFHCY